MAEPDWNPDTGGRSLAEILREAGVESAARAKRRRSWDDPEEAGLRQRRAEAAADMSNRTGYGRRRSDLEDSGPIREPARESAGVRERSGGDPRAAAPREMREQREVRAPRDDSRAPRETPAPRDAREGRGTGVPRRPLVADPSTAAIPGLRPDRKPSVPGGAAALDRTPPQRSGATMHPVTGPIPVVRADRFDGAEDLDEGPRESALAWFRFAGELVIALAVGIGIYFAATVLWEMVPYLAVLLVPVAVTSLVAGVGAWRHRMGRESVGPRLLAVLVFAGTLLTIVPAAQVLGGG